MRNYTPTTEDIVRVLRSDGTISRTQFDRWHADVIRKAKEQGWEEGITASGINLDWQLHLLDHNPYMEEP